MLVALAVQACDSGTTEAPPTPPDPIFVVTLGASTLVVPAGGTTRTPIVTTGTLGLATEITFTVTGAPPGLAAGVSRTSVADSSTLIVAAAGLLPPGTYPIVVNVTLSSIFSQHLPVTVVVTGAAGIAPAINLVASGAHTCALAMNGAAYCWGYNGNGQLGNNDTSLVNPSRSRWLAVSNSRASPSPRSKMSPAGSASVVRLTAGEERRRPAR